MSKDTYQDAARKIFSDDFLIFLDSIPKNKSRAKKVITMSNSMNKILAGKRLDDCILALTFYLACVLVDNDIDFEEAMEDIKAFKGDINSENYIQ